MHYSNNILHILLHDCTRYFILFIKFKDLHIKIRLQYNADGSNEFEISESTTSYIHIPNWNCVRSTAM